MACGSARISIHIELSFEPETTKTSSTKVSVKLPKSKPKERPSDGERCTIVLGESELVAKMMPRFKNAVGLTDEPIGEPLIFECTEVTNGKYKSSFMFRVAEGEYKGKYLDKYRREYSGGKDRVVLFDYKSDNPTYSDNPAQCWIVEKIDGGFSLTPYCSLDRPEGKKSLTIGEDGLVLCKTEFTPVTFRYI